LIDDPEALEAFLRDAGFDVSVTEPPLLTVTPTGDDPSEPRTGTAFWPLVITAIVVAVLLVLLGVLFVFYRSRISKHQSNGNDASGLDAKQAAGGRVAVRRTPPPTRPSQDESESSAYAETEAV
jgi:hypothetical protein